MRPYGSNLLRSYTIPLTPFLIKRFNFDLQMIPIYRIVYFLITGECYYVQLNQISFGKSVTSRLNKKFNVQEGDMKKDVKEKIFCLGKENKCGLLICLCVEQMRFFFLQVKIISLRPTEATRSDIFRVWEI